MAVRRGASLQTSSTKSDLQRLGASASVDSLITDDLGKAAWNMTTLNKLAPMCAYFDDDSLYPGAAGPVSCTTKDVQQCDKCVPGYASTGDNNCYDACGTTCDFKSAGIDDVPDDVPNASYTFSCAWSAVADLRSTCGGGFVTTFPSASNAAEPELGSLPAFTFTNIDPCSIHAYCYACSGSGEGGGTNKYCEAVANYYTSDDDVEINFNGALAALNDQGYWCDESVLSSIEAGAFSKTCDVSLALDQEGHCDV